MITHPAHPSFQSQKTGVSLVLHASSTLRRAPRKPAALAAAFVIARWHPEHIAFAARTMAEPLSQPWERPARRRAKANGAHRKDEARLSRRDVDDERLLDAMRRNTEATIGELATAVGKSRTSIVSGLHRLRDAGLTEPANGKWKLTEEPLPREPPAKWTAPLSASQRAHARA
jgi:DNA-binding transcriptional ArsR family regulator